MIGNEVLLVFVMILETAGASSYNGENGKSPNFALQSNVGKFV